ncbi:hypothetical protein CO172_02465 [Candidatus Uhrbacteria bacterium CG_4_9_14_3_um_filter_36_7]|uniref:Aminoglycoside phosphotransferase domain-containing protein n=1 Tax=Candidatus Uhrbacteria bacterium CG_4_9_14_3_um_filter_36_7 TaxID=1975033 RepID=A0A2M7XH87_9BACT|nr:MAG: hypothetical protein CO172_02465 [Candidatus Uhrbacteria bacterium CG_4_9_14_3_um_filter_36_7]
MKKSIGFYYFSQGDFSQRQEEVLQEVVAKTGFELKEKIFVGTIYDKNKIGSIIFSGVYKNKSAVLKLQGLKPDLDEPLVIEKFYAQNKSNSIRLPEIYFFEPWQEDKGYGFFIAEQIETSRIFEMPFANQEQMHTYITFYQDYRTKAITQPWSKNEIPDPLRFTFERIDNWRKISESKKRLKTEDYVPYLLNYYPLVSPHLSKFNMVFSHGHLTANDIYKDPKNPNGFILFSNLWWSYRLEWYELAFNLWACVNNIKDTSKTFEQIRDYLEDWIKIYKTIPVVQTDSDFDEKISVLLLERFLGAILVDIGVHDQFEDPKNKELFEYLLDLNQKLFEYFAGKLGVSISSID